MKYWLAVLVLFAAVSASAQTLPVLPDLALPELALPELALPELVPAPQEAVTCGPWQQTALETAGGSTCAIASTSLHGELLGAANCACGFCSQQFVDKACQVIQGGFSVSGYLRYRCRLEIC